MGKALFALGALCIAGALLLPVDVGAETSQASQLRHGWVLFKLCLALLGAALSATGWLLRRSESTRTPDETAPAPWQLLAAILLVAAALRLLGLGTGLWYDEVVTLVEFVRLPTGDLLTSYTTPNNHILYSLCAQLTVGLCGEGAVGLRLPAALFGTLSLLAVWLLGTRVTSRREAALATAVLTVSYHHVWFSQNARGYTGLLLTVVLATWLFMRGMRRPARSLWVGYAAVAALALYTHLSAVFVLTIHALVFAVMYARRRLRQPAANDPYPGAAEAWPWIGFGLAAVLALQLYALLIPQMLETFGKASSGNVKIESWTNPLWTAIETLRGLGLGPLSVAAGLFGAAVMGVGLVSYARRDPVFAAVIALPVPLTLAVLTALSFHVWPRYFFVLAGFAALVLMRGIAVIAGAVDHRLPTVAGVGAVLLALSMLPANYRLPKQDYAGARDWVETQRTSDEPVLTIGLASFPYEHYYAPAWTAIDDIAELEAIRARHARVWLVYSLPTALATSHPALARHVEVNFEVAREFYGTLANGTITVCRSR